MASKAAGRASESAGQALEETECFEKGWEGLKGEDGNKNENKSSKSITWSAVRCAPLVSLKLNLKLAN